MLKKVVVSLIGVVLLVIPLALASCAPAEEKEPIKLGCPLSLSSASCQQQRKGALLAAEEINDAGGLLGGRPLEVIVVDDEGTQEGGIAALQKLQTVDEVDIFIGGMSSWVHMGQIPTLKSYEKVTVWMGSASHFCEEAIGPVDWYFHIHPWDYQQGQSQSQAWEDITAAYNFTMDSMFVAYEEGSFGAGSYAAIQAIYGNWTTVEGESFKSAFLGGGDYTAVLEHAKAANPDAFVWVGYEADAYGMSGQAKSINFTPPVFAGSPPSWPSDFAGSALANGVCFPTMWTPSLGDVSPVSASFFDAFVDKWGEEPLNYCAPLGYTNVYIVAEAIERAATLEKEAMIDALEATAYDSPFGVTITFTPSNICLHQGLDTMLICQYQSGTEEVLWPFDIKTAPIVYPFTW